MFHTRSKSAPETNIRCILNLLYSSRLGFKTDEVSMADVGKFVLNRGPLRNVCNILGSIRTARQAYERKTYIYILSRYICSVIITLSFSRFQSSDNFAPSRPSDTISIQSIVARLAR